MNASWLIKNGKLIPNLYGLNLSFGLSREAFVMLRLVFLLLFIFNFSWAFFRCPARTGPCQCRGLKVRCDDVGSLESVLPILEEQFSEQNLPSLQLKRVHSFSLPPRALGTLSPARFFLTDSDIRHIDKDAFDGQDNLVLLVLSSNRLEEIPTGALQHVKKLQTLGLAGNFLMRVLDSSLEHLTKLRFLVLSYNRISMIERNAFPRHLETLALTHNMLDTFNDSLHDLHQLETLWASNNRLTSVKGQFKGLVNLRALLLDRNYLSDISDSFSDLESLTDLSLSDNRIQDIGKTLVGLPALKSLNLSHNYITDLHWKTFESLKDLRILDISRNYLKTVCPILKPLRSLRELYLSDLSLKSLDPDCFYNMKSLTKLDLSYNLLSDTQAISHNPLPLITHLFLHHNRMNIFRYDFKYAKSLKYLDISYNNFTTFKSQHLSHNGELETLILEGKQNKSFFSFFRVT